MDGSPERAFASQGALSHHVEIVWQPTAETSDTNAIHDELASAAPSQQAVTARSANELQFVRAWLRGRRSAGNGSQSANVGGLRMLKKLLIASAMISVAALAAPSYAAAAEPTIPIIVKDTTSPYWQIVLAGARKAGKDLGVNVPELGAQSESDINGEISILENAVAGKPAAVVIAPTEFKALGKPIDEAAKKVPIIGVDSAADSKAFTSFLTTDNVQGGRIAADGLAQAITEKYGKAEGEVAQITSLPGVGSLEGRRKGFLEELGKYPGLKVVADKYADGMATTALNIMTDLITANPNLRGVFANNLIMAQGAGQAIAENKKADTIKMVGFDGDDKTVGMLKDGTIYALVLQDPYRMGYDGVKTALAASKGEKVDAFVDTGANLITKANMGGEKQQALLNPKVK
jgi:ribose transport system substrate-binding protein